MSQAAATLHFNSDWSEVLNGELAQGGKVTLNFDPRRLPFCRLKFRGAEVWSIVGYITFHPRGRTFGRVMMKQVRDGSQGGLVVALEPQPVEVSIPVDAERMQIWFINSHWMSSPCETWDSRFGQDYWWDIERRPPNDPVMFRAGAILSPEMVNLISAEFGERGSGGHELAARAGLNSYCLSVKAWVRNVSFTKNVWIDLHSFDGKASRVHSQTVPLHYVGAAEGKGDFFAVDVPIPAEAKGTQFRLYYEVDHKVFSDAVLHQVVQQRVVPDVKRAPRRASPTGSLQRQSSLK